MRLVPKFVRMAFVLLFLSAGVSLSVNATSQEISFGDALVDAADRGSSVTVSQLLNSSYPADSRGKFSVTALMRAAYRGNREIAERLLNVGANPNAVDVGGATALHLASREGHTEVVTLLLKYNAFVDIADDEGWTPLMRAALANKTEVVKALIKAGADVNATNKYKETPLTQAVQRRNVNVAQLLIDNGANPAHTNSTGFSVLDIAKRKRNQPLEDLIRTSLDKHYATSGKGTQVAATQGAKNPNLQLEVKNAAKEEKKVVKTDIGDEERARKQLEIVQTMDKILRKDGGKEQVELAEADAVDIEGTPWVSTEAGRETAEIVPPAPPTAAPKKVAAAAHPSPILRPYRQVEGTPWAAAKQEELVEKLKSIGIASEEQPEESEEFSQETEVATEPLFTEPLKSEDSSSQVATLATPPPSPPASMSYREDAVKTLPADVMPWRIASAEPAAEQKSAAPEPEELEQAAAKPESNKPENLNTNKGIVFAQSAQPVSSNPIEIVRDIENRPWLTPAELRQEIPARASVQSKTKELASAKIPANTSQAVEKSAAVEKPAAIVPSYMTEESKLSQLKPASGISDGGEEEVFEENVQKNKSAEASNSGVVTTSPAVPVESVREEPVKPLDQPLAKIEEKEESAAPVALQPENKEELTPGSAGTVEVAEAIRVPISETSETRNNVSVTKDPASAISKKKLPNGFLPSATAIKGKKYWLELSKFASEEDAISYFDEVTDREKLYLRMRIIRQASAPRANQQVALRVGTFDDNKKAADVCVTFANPSLKCAIVMDSGSSAPAKSAPTFRFGFERNTYQNEYAYVTPRGSDFYWVQLGTYANEFDAIGQWQQLIKDHGDVLESLKVSLTTPKMSSSASQSLRLRAGPFMAKADANSTCRRLKERHVSCLAVSGQ